MKDTKNHNFKTGDILYSSWGYDQTNINFYQVTKLVGKTMVELREVHSAIHDTPHMTYQDVVAVKDSFMEPSNKYDSRGKIMKRKVNKYGGVKINDCYSAYPWDGRPKYETALGFGH